MVNGVLDIVGTVKPLYICIAYICVFKWIFWGIHIRAFITNITKVLWADRFIIRLQVLQIN